MELGMLGLGRMGFNMALRLLRGGHQVTVWNRSSEKAAELAVHGAVPAASPQALAAHLTPPRILWLMLPSGPVTEEMIARLRPSLRPGDLVIDGGNAHYRDSARRAELLAADSLHFLDAGTSGGIWGLENGYCLMVGGPREAFLRAEPIFATLAPPAGYLHTGPSGSGHFTKMVHNGIEYALLEAYAEGFELLAASGYELDPAAISRLWNRGSVVRSWILELAERVYARDPSLRGVRGWVEDSGEGRWTVAEAIERGVPAPVITLSLLQRLRSRQDDSYAMRLIAALRGEFGGHAVRPSGDTGANR